MMYLIKEIHSHTISSVQQEYEILFNLPLYLLDANENETFSSVNSQFFCYNDNKFYNIELYRSVVKSVIHPDQKNKFSFALGTWITLTYYLDQSSLWLF